MNLVDGTLIHRDGAMEARIGGHRLPLPGHDPALHFTAPAAMPWISRSEKNT